MYAHDLSGKVRVGTEPFRDLSCYHRRPSFTVAISKQGFEAGLERVRRSFGFYLYGYVVVPERVRLLLGQPRKALSPTR